MVAFIVGLAVLAALPAHLQELYSSVDEPPNLPVHGLDDTEDDIDNRRDAWIYKRR